MGARGARLARSGPPPAGALRRAWRHRRGGHLCRGVRIPLHLPLLRAAAGQPDGAHGHGALLCCAAGEVHMRSRCWRGDLPWRRLCPHLPRRGCGGLGEYRRAALPPRRPLDAGGHRALRAEQRGAGGSAPGARGHAGAVAGRPSAACRCGLRPAAPAAGASAAAGRAAPPGRALPGGLHAVPAGILLAHAGPATAQLRRRPQPEPARRRLLRGACGGGALPAALLPALRAGAVPRPRRQRALPAAPRGAPAWAHPRGSQTVPAPTRTHRRNARGWRSPWHNTLACGMGGVAAALGGCQLG
mmetsp:Transcript_39924/g.103327  ORF Transcript_39924/g.103327 Transcript_39924/m.103327 type:complete len:301 (+) Transcript_39924:35-937(+)